MTTLDRVIYLEKKLKRAKTLSSKIQIQDELVGACSMLLDVHKNRLSGFLTDEKFLKILQHENKNVRDVKKELVKCGDCGAEHNYLVPCKCKPIEEF